jgi:outer membrane receptor protein involved in Fe transport
MMTGKNGVLGVLACSTVCAGTQVMAEESSAPVSVEEIVVTAQKRSERLQDVPVSVTAVEAAGLTERNALQLQDYLNDVPNVSAGDLGNGRTSVVIRGISTGFGNNPTTGFTIDDVPFGSSTSSGLGDVLVPNLDPADLQRVEVLRGPQGTLYGASSMGGLVKYVTVDPRTDDVGGQVEVDGSTVAHGGAGYGTRGSVDVPVLKDELGVRLSGFYRHDPGYIDDTLQHRSDVNSGKTYGGRAAALWHIVPSVDLRLAALIQNRSADASGTEDVSAAGVPLTGDLTHQKLPGTDGYDTKVRLYSATLTADLGDLTLTSISGYNEIETNYPQDVSGNFGPFTPAFYGQSLAVRINNLFQTHKFSQEVRLASASNHHLEWQVGAFYTHETSPITESIFPVAPGTGAALPLQSLVGVDSRSAYKEAAGFGDLTYYFTDRLDLTVGGRYSHNSQDSNEVDTGALIGPDPSVTVASSSDHSWTYLVTPRFHISDSLMSYARVASGYRPGGSNAGAVPGVPATFGPDRTVNYELGLKGDLLNRRLSFQADVFYIDWTHIQVRQVDVNNGFSYYGNAGKAKSRGTEISVEARPAAGLTLGANLSYTDAFLTEPAPPGVYAPSGSRLPNSSKWAGNVSAQQEMPLTQSINGFGSIKVNYTGDRLAGFQTKATVPRFVLPSYTTLDVELGAKAEQWTTTFFARNLTDKRAFLDANALNSVTGVGAYYASVIMPRTFGVSLTTRF